MDAIDELMVLVCRLARQKSVALETDFAASIPALSGVLQVSDACLLSSG